MIHGEGFGQLRLSSPAPPSARDLLTRAVNQNPPFTDQRQHLDLLMRKYDITAATLAVYWMRNLVSCCSQGPRRLAATCADAVV